ncbi:MAG: ABC transporter ATP-binding protein [Planctomycetes bacterium]|jgi:ABC-2 type transport system ATP-binding protein|nr:ABC transporter ATP-binding protein [Planctomycetota bacterium]
MTEKIILQVTNLIKEYKDVKAVNNISFNIKSGQIVGLLGPNGAGKTTTISMILGITEPSGGDISIFGKSIKEGRSEINNDMNFAAVYSHLPNNLTVKQNLQVFGLLYGVKNLKEKIPQLLKDFTLEKFADTKAGLLSSGEISRLNLAKAIINEPKLLLLDEPTASLDPHSADIVRELIKEYVKKKGIAILWTSHNMKEIELACDEVLFLSHGNILLSGDPKVLPAKYGKKDLEELFITVAREPLTLS